MQQRQHGKDVCPGLWDLSAAEHLKPSETYEEGALRGLQEELGVAGVVLQRIGGVVHARLDLDDRGIRDYELQQSFRGIFDGEVRPDPSEVLAVESTTPSELAAAFEARPNDFTPWFRATAVRVGLFRDKE